ncbi:hypothetical protein HMPREF1531_00913 [Propionibacterium sp. oral taxon 192 str. F0372]|uniref:DUF6286 domain-containing protein n=1 Tax=Propionibacterium sp. oral taxon 192 TaxID=671222 RepID=UPI00035294E0|nr:DUF6286 domain-containing protein [Propionibacterium sp. oral taxon 192]EPH06263.1 hypothetical protein HMPREF1531_00913 [Propionibacterium sp. oral taxon 192 str. F0372]
MRAPVPKLIRRPSRSAPSVVLALLLLAVGGLGAWLTGHRIVTGTWPDRTLTTLDAIGSTTLGSAAVLTAAGIAAACGLAMILAALWPGLPERVEILPDGVPGQTAVRRRDLAKLVRTQVEQIGGIHSVAVTTRRSRVDVIVLSVLDNLDPVHEAARKKTDEVLQTLQPVGITRSRVRIRRTS